MIDKHVIRKYGSRRQYVVSVSVSDKKEEEREKDDQVAIHRNTITSLLI